MSGTSGPRRWRGSLVLFWMGVFTNAIVSLPSGGSVVSLAASFVGTTMLYVLRPVYFWLHEWACQAFHAGVRAAEACLGAGVLHVIPTLCLAFSYFARHTTYSDGS